MEHDLLTWKERGYLWLRLGIRGGLTAAAAAFLVWAGPPLLSLLLPFVLGLIVAWILNPPVRWLQRRLGISRNIISLLLLLLIFCTLGALLFGLVRAAVREVQSLFENWDAVTAGLITVLETVKGWIRTLDGCLPQGVSLSADSLLHSLADWVRNLDVSGWLTSLAGRAPSLVSGLSGFAIAAVAFLMASYFITGDYPRLRFLVTDRVPADARDFCGTVRKVFMEAFGGYLRSQLILTGGVFLILAVGFTVIGQPYGLVLAVVMSIMDFIPLIGAGTAMVPWILLDMVSRDYPHAIQFAVIWGLVVVFRRVAEPKILGDQTGLSPIASLIGIYVGMRLGGVAGMILGPLVLLVCFNLARLGTFRPLAGDVRMAVRDVRALLRGDAR